MENSKDILKPLREQIYNKLRKTGWSLMHLAVVCGISYKTLENILYKRRNGISLSTVVKISEGIGIPIAALIDDGKTED